MRGINPEKMKEDWADPQEQEIIARINKKTEEILELKEELERESKALQKLARKKRDGSLLESIEEADYCLEALETDLKDFREEIGRARLPEACHLLTVLEEKVGSLK